MAAESHSDVFYRSPRAAYPLAVKAAGLTIEDSDGRRYLDMSGGAAVSCLGHAHPDVLQAIHGQLDRLAFAHTTFFSNEPQETLACVLVRRFGQPRSRAYFVAGGSEANETAMKMAWQYHAAKGAADKRIVISREHSYHGNTFGALSASGNPGRRRASAAPLVDWPRIVPCYAYRGREEGESDDEYAARTAGELKDAIEAAGPERVAAFMAEIVVGSSLGVVSAVPGYFERIRAICDEYDVLFIADEIMCGSGRTGTFFAHEQEGVKPDLVTLAKGIGGGYLPLGAVVAGERVAEALTAAGFVHGHTYVGHAAACAAGAAVQAVIERDRLLERVTELGEHLAAVLDARFGEHPNVGDIRSRGLFAGVEFVADRDSKAGFDNATGLPETLRKAAMDEGLICYPGSITMDGLTVPHVMLAPPFIARRADIDDGLDRLDAAVRRVFDGH